MHGEDVGKLAVVALRPEMAAGRDVVELRRDAQAIAAAPHAAFEHIADAELARDFVHVHGAALVDEGRVAGDDEEPAQLRQRRDDVLADAVGEIVLLAVAAHIGEGQHGDRGTVGQRERRQRRLGDTARLRRGRALRLDGADETKALARDGTDQRLVRAAVADRLARCVDPAGQGGFGDAAPVPDLVDQLILADHPVTVLHEVDDEVEDLRLHGHGNLLAAQLAPVGVEKVVPEHKLHVENSTLAMTSGNDEIRMDFDSKTVSALSGPPGSPRSRDGCYAVFGWECNLNENVAGLVDFRGLRT
ncbi:hypothetical protein ABIF67_005596 [Bradyrhizobium japonicum]